MSWQSEDGEHEGYVDRLLPGGQIAVGSTARRDDDGRLVHYEVVWDDDDPKRERYVPSSEVYGWHNACTCGWTGTRYTRVTDPAQASIAEGRLYRATDDIGDIPQEFEDALREEWQRVHLGPLDALADITAAADAVARQQHVLAQAVHTARARGLSWDKIGAAAGVTRQTAHERWARTAPDAVAEQDWQVRARVRLLRDVRTGGAGQFRYGRAGEELTMVMHGHAGHRPDIDYWSTDEPALDALVAHIADVEVLEVLYQTSPWPGRTLFADAPETTEAQS